MTKRLDDSYLLELVPGRSLGIQVGRLSLHFLALGFLGQLALEALPLSRLQKEGVFLDIFNDAFLLNLPFESPEERSRWIRHRTSVLLPNHASSKNLVVKEYELQTCRVASCLFRMAN
jgi:hypothetical protein